MRAILVALLALTAGPDAARSTGTLIISVLTPIQKKISGITVVIRCPDGRADSSTTRQAGVVKFANVCPGNVIVETHDRIWLQRRKGAYIATRRDTVKVKAGRTTRYVAEMSQRVPPALYR